MSDFSHVDWLQFVLGASNQSLWSAVPMVFPKDDVP